MTRSALGNGILRPRNRPRACDGCGEGYARRNLVEAWTVQNHGHRLGWTKLRLRLCTRCSPAYAARRILMAASRVAPRA